jgi:hypothetical protein
MSHHTTSLAPEFNTHRAPRRSRFQQGHATPPEVLVRRLWAKDSVIFIDTWTWDEATPALAAARGSQGASHYSVEGVLPYVYCLSTDTTHDASNASSSLVRYQVIDTHEVHR